MTYTVTLYLAIPDAPESGRRIAKIREKYYTRGPFPAFLIRKSMRRHPDALYEGIIVRIEVKRGGPALPRGLYKAAWAFYRADKAEYEAGWGKWPYGPIKAVCVDAAGCVCVLYRDGTFEKYQKKGVTI